MRTFISIDMPEKVKYEIRKIQDMLPRFTGKKIEFENLHLTLKFLGEVDENKIGEIKKKLRRINFNKFEAEINKLGVFSEKFIRIIWLSLKNCEKLQKEIDEKLKDLFERQKAKPLATLSKHGQSKEKRFMSHLTIARIKKIADKKEFLKKLKEIKIKPIKFTISNFKFKNSFLKPEGPVYETIEEYLLKKENINKKVF